MTFLRFGSDIYKWMNINNVRPFAPIRYCNYWRLRVSIKLVIQEIESMNNSWMRDLDTCIIHLCNGLRTKSCISEYWTKGNIIGWPNICRPNWPKIFPFVQYSLYLFTDCIIKVSKSIIHILYNKALWGHPWVFEKLPSKKWSFKKISKKQVALWLKMLWLPNRWL